MCILDEIAPSMTSVQEVFAIHTKKVMNHLLQLPAQLFALGKNVITDLTKIARSSNGLDTMLRLADETCQMVDLMQCAEKAVRPIFVAAAAASSFMGAGRIINSISYIAKGNFYKDIIEGNFLSLTSALSFFARRIAVTMDWLVAHKVVDAFPNVDILLQLAEKIGLAGVYSAVSEYVPRVTGKQFCDGALVAALVPQIIQHGQKVVNGEDATYNFFEGVSAAADVAAVVLQQTPFNNPYVIGGLSLIAATTGAFAFFTDPANTQTKNPFINR